MLEAGIYKRSMLFMLLILVVQLAVASEHAKYDRIQLSAQATQDVKNDLIIAVFAAERQGKDVTKLASEVNRLVNTAVARVKQINSVDVQTLNYQTVPVYEKQRQTGWRVRQSLQLKSRDRNVLSKLIGELQHTLMLEGMGYQVSREQRNKVQESLIGKAIAEFGKRARIITRQLGSKNYRLVNMQIDTSGTGIHPVPVQRYQVMGISRAEPAAIETGTQTVTVTASGMIELEQK